MKVVTVSTDGLIKEVDVEVNLEWLQSAVGGYIEAVGLEDGNMYLNEEGKLKGLPVNEVATRLARSRIMTNDVIVGSVVLLGSPDDEGKDTPISDKLLKRIRRIV